MGPLFETLNDTARWWIPWMLRAAWQGAVVWALALIALAAWRRATPQWRYGLLLVVLVKFALPPNAANSLGLFEWLPALDAPVFLVSQPASKAATQTTAPFAPLQIHIIQSSAPKDGDPIAVDLPAPRDPIAVDLPCLPDPIAIGIPFLGRHVTLNIFVPGDGKGAVGVSQPAPGDPRSPKGFTLTPAAWTMVAQWAGVWALTAFVVTQASLLRRRVRKAKRISEGPLCDLAAGIARAMGLNQPPALYLTDRFQSPQAGGFLRPFVLLPRWIEDASGEDARALLAHEIAHLVRRDPLVSWLQVAFQVFLWWNPVVWLLNRQIRNAREECCDDKVLALGLARGERYSRILVDVAARLTRRELALETLGMADAFRPVRRRIGRILDAGLKRPARISAVSLVSLLFIATIVWPGAPSAQIARPSAPVGQSTDRSTHGKSRVDGESTKPKQAEVNYLGQANFPRVIELDPPNGAADVDPARGHITVTFDRPMRNGYSWVDKGKRPKIERIEWINDKQCRAFVTLEPDREYGVWLNYGSNTSKFRSAEGVSAERVYWKFHTRPGSTQGRNQTAVTSGSLDSTNTSSTASEIGTENMKKP